MSIDTRMKRFSMMQFGDTDITLFESDGAVDADDRFHLLGLYSGITLASPSAFELDTLPTYRMFKGNPP